MTSQKKLPRGFHKPVWSTISSLCKSDFLVKPPKSQSHFTSALNFHFFFFFFYLSSFPPFVNCNFLTYDQNLGTSPLFQQKPSSPKKLKSLTKKLFNEDYAYVSEVLTAVYKHHQTKNSRLANSRGKVERNHSPGVRGQIKIPLKP